MSKRCVLVWEFSFCSFSLAGGGLHLLRAHGQLDHFSGTGRDLQRICKAENAAEPLKVAASFSKCGITNPWKQPNHVTDGRNIQKPQMILILEETLQIQVLNLYLCSRSLCAYFPTLSCSPPKARDQAGDLRPVAHDQFVPAIQQDCLKSILAQHSRGIMDNFLLYNDWIVRP